MSWAVKQDRDASKEVWLLFENDDGKFPLYPGETVWISYVYTVRFGKWGPWWQRAIRLPTRRLSMTLALPARFQPAVWGMETSMTAEALPFRTPITRQEQDDQVIFSWSTEEPPLHARYRIEWKFRAPGHEEAAEVETASPSEVMRSLDIAQEGDQVLGEVARPFDLPAEAEDARRVVAQLPGARLPGAQLLQGHGPGRPADPHQPRRRRRPDTGRPDHHPAQPSGQR
jgi:hypothetical protein